MMKHLTIASIAAALMIAPSHAATIDFANYADTMGERGLANGATLTIDGVNVMVNAWSEPLDARAHHPYLDAGNAGLGVCQVLDDEDQCDPGSDDNVSVDEAIMLDFDDDITITELVFRDVNHNILNAANDGTIRIVNNSGGDMTALISVFISMAASHDAFFSDFDSIIFFHRDTEFYLSSLDVIDAPIPGAIPLLLSGLAGLGFASRKKKTG